MRGQILSFHSVVPISELESKSSPGHPGSTELFCLPSSPWSLKPSALTVPLAHMVPTTPDSWHVWTPSSTCPPLLWLCPLFRIVHLDPHIPPSHQLSSQTLSSSPGSSDGPHPPLLSSKTERTSDALLISCPQCFSHHMQALLQGQPC